MESTPIIFAASLPLATSTNNLHAWSTWNASYHMTDNAQAYIDHVLRILNYYPITTDKRQFAPFEIVHLDMDRIQVIRELKLNKSRAKAVQERHRRYRMDMLCVFDDDRRDLDNCWKLCQDTVVNWIGFNDRRIIETFGRKVIDRDIAPHAEVVIREALPCWRSGDLLREVKAEIALDYESLEGIV